MIKHGNDTFYCQRKNFMVISKLYKSNYIILSKQFTTLSI